MNTAIERYLEGLRRKEEIKNDFSYIEWLEEFTKKFKSFTDDKWDYNKDALPEEDLKNVKNLTLFFEVISDYAKENYINSDYNYCSTHYYIKYNDVGYKISLYVGQGSFSACKRIEIEETKTFIDYKDIVNNLITKRAAIINEKLNEFSKFVEQMLNIGIPLYVVKDYINKMK